MTNSRTLQHAVIISYLLMTLTGFVFTFTHIHIPIVPYLVTRLSYGMMAPYQSYITEDFALVAEGFSNGVWQTIDLAPYLPFGRGEQNIRGALPTFRFQGEERMLRAYQSYGEQLLRLEAEQGRVFDRVRFTIEQWPASPGGFGELRKDPYIKRTFILEHP